MRNKLTTNIMFIVIYTIILGRVASDALSSDCAARARLPLFRSRPGLDAFVIGCRCVIRPSGDPATDYRAVFCPFRCLFSFLFVLSSKWAKTRSAGRKCGAGDANCSLGA